MKILVILNKNELTGPNVVAANTIKALADLGHELLVIFLRRSGKAKLPLDNCNNVRVKQLDVGYVKKVLEIRKVIKNFEPSVVHSHCFVPDLYNSIAANGIAKVNTIHNIPSEDYILRYGKFKGWLLYFLHTLINNSLDNNICVSETVCKKTFRLSQAGKSVIYNSVSDEFYKYVYEPVQEIILVYCGHFSAIKNPILIVQALLKVNVPFKFYGLGDGEQLDKCIDLTKDDERFVFYGRVNNVYKYLHKSHCLIHFSQTEGFCLAVAEALVSRMSIISNDLPVVREFKEKFNANNIYICNERGDLVRDLENAIKDVSLKIKNSDFNVDIAADFKEATNTSCIAIKHIELYNKVIS